jgi:hypothetical protein
MVVTERCVSAAYRRMVSIVSPMSSMRAGRSSPAGKMSITPPRTQNSPCSSTGSCRVQPDVLVKGADWPADQIVGRDIVEARGGVVIRVPVAQGHSTTGVLKKLRR